MKMLHWYSVFDKMNEKIQLSTHKQGKEVCIGVRARVHADFTCTCGRYM